MLWLCLSEVAYSGTAVRSKAMEYYQELTILPAYDVPENFIWSKVYQQLHLALASEEKKTVPSVIGFSFPGYKNDAEQKTLGTKLRIFSTEDGLRQLALEKWLNRLLDYVHLTRPRRVPAEHGFAVYSRVHSENSRFQKARRYAGRHNVTEQEAMALFPVTVEKCNYPFVQLTSLSNQQKFCLYIKKEAVEAEQQGKFTSYGLSEAASVPEF